MTVAVRDVRKCGNPTVPCPLPPVAGRAVGVDRSAWSHAAGFGWCPTQAVRLGS